MVDMRYWDRHEPTIPSDKIDWWNMWHGHRFEPIEDEL